MCQVHLNPVDTSTGVTITAETDAPVMSKPKSTGSRRRLLWELDGRAHCPIVGICLPVPVLHRMVDKAYRGQNINKGYDLHKGAVAECKTRNLLTEAIQRELGQRYKMTLQQAARLKTTDALSAWWQAESPKDLAGALWATLTHPRCTPELERQILGEVHMLQHQVGATQRADLKRMEAVLDENAVLGRVLARVQQRQSQLSNKNVERQAALQAQIMQLRGEVITRDTLLMALQAQLQKLEVAVPDLACRAKQAAELQQQADRIHALERALLLTQQKSERQSRLIAAQTSEPACRVLQADSASQLADTLVNQTKCLDDRAVLCVGGRTASVPLYRHIVEGTGGRFLHHDGGDEESVSKLDATLAAADLVICQTGCISHDAYWRVKDHCKRTGKQCVFVENTGTTSLKRALVELQQSD